MKMMITMMKMLMEMPMGMKKMKKNTEMKAKMMIQNLIKGQVREVEKMEDLIREAGRDKSENFDVKQLYKSNFCNDLQFDN